MAGVALDDIDCYFAWQAWHLWHWVGSGGALGQPWRRDAAAFCVAGVALRDICLHFVWQAWHLTTSIVTLRGRRGTYGTGLALAARLVSHGAVTPRRFAWQAWHFVTSTFDPPSLCVAGMALDDMDCYFAWQAWRLWHWVGSGGALGQPWRRDAAAFFVADVALRDICLHFVWQASHFVTSTFTLCGRRGTYGTGLALVARLVLGVAPGTPRLAWQAWHLETSTFVSRGRRGTW